MKHRLILPDISDISHRDEEYNYSGECMGTYDNGNIESHHFKKDDHYHGEYKGWDENGNLMHHSLDEGSKEVALVVFQEADRYTGVNLERKVVTYEELVEIARERNLPLLEDIPAEDDEEGKLLWRLKHPDIPLLPYTTTITIRKPKHPDA